MKEFYKFSNGDDHYALDVREMLFFQTNELAREILDRYPQIEGLFSSYSSREIEQTLEALRETGIFDDQPNLRDEDPALPPPITSLEVGCDRVEQAMNFLLQQPGEHDHCYLVIKIDPGENEKIPLKILKEIQSKRQKHLRRAIRIVVSIKGFPRSRVLTEFLVKQQLRVELHVTLAEIEELETITDSFQYPKALLPKTIVSINYAGESMDQLEQATNSLHNKSFRRVMVDVLCSACKSGKVDIPENIRRTFLGGGRQENRSMVNLVPFGISILTSDKNIHGCGAGNLYFAVSSDGNLFPCRRYIHQPEFCLGNLETGIDTDAQKKLIAPSVDQIPQCRPCGIRYICGGSTLKKRKVTSDICRLHDHLARRSMILHSQYDLIQKAVLKGTYRDLQKTLPTSPYFYMPLQSSRQPTQDKTLTVHGKSMRPLLREGDSVLVKPILKKKIKIGDIVCFGKPVTCHRVVWKWETNGKVTVWEKGDNSTVGSKIPASEIYGIVTTIFKENRKIETLRFPWIIINRFMALISCITMITREIFQTIKRSRRN